MISHRNRHGYLTTERREVRLISDSLVSVDTDIDPVTTAEVKEYLVIEHSDDDTLLDLLRTTAVSEFERMTSHYLDEQTRAATFNGAAPEYRIPAIPFGSLTKVESLDEGSATDEGASNFYVSGARPARVRIKRGTSFEHPLQEVKITYVCGYATTGDVPEQVKMILKKMIADLYEFRTSVHQEGNIPRELPMKWEDLISTVSLIHL